jgi:glucokinase
VAPPAAPATRSERAERPERPERPDRLRHDAPRLIADIGGTWARFILETAPGRFEHGASLRTAEHADFHAAVRHYLAGVPPGHIRHAAVAIANPVEGDLVRMTNYPWQFSIEQMRQRLALETLVVVNDFTALAMAIPRLPAHACRAVGGGVPRPHAVIGVIGAGTGLGVSGVIPAGDGHVALGTEGGHASFSPHDERELVILRHAWKQYRHVSFERLLSGPGLELIHRALAEDAGRAGTPPLAAPEITRRALAGSDPLAVAALEAFCAMLGTAAGNLAVTLGALGGVFVGGGIVPRLGAWFDTSPFRARFEDKGRFSDWLRAIPTYVVTAEDATFEGVSAILAAQLRERGEGERGAAAGVLAQIRRAEPKLSPAEQRVAAHVLAHPRAVLSQPIAEIARIAEVSQPTVIRFCRSLGCEGLSDFKLRLASGLTGTIPLTHTQVTGADSMLELGVKVLGNTAGAILALREQLNREAIDRAIEALAAARHIQCHAVGYYAVVADDAQFKFLRFRVPCVACTDPRRSELGAGVLAAGDAVLLVSGEGRRPELLEVADAARERGAAVIAITAGQSPLARRADIALIVDHGEDIATHVPMVSRILHLLVVDILAVGVAMRRGSADATAMLAAGATAAGAAAPTATRAAAPGVATAAPLAQLTSHAR